jgi:hypothetical protein
MSSPSECDLTCSFGSVCTVAAEGQRICGHPTADCDDAVSCETSAGYEQGEVCAVSCCDGGDTICFNQVDCTPA